MKTNTTSYPNLISAMEFTNNVCALLVAIELSAEQLDADTIKRRIQRHSLPGFARI